MRKNLNQLGAWLGLVLAGFWITPLGQAQVQVTDNVVVVVDASGSMGTHMAGTGRDRMTVAKDALKQVLAQIPDTTHIGILVFPRGDWIYPLGPRKESMLAGAIDSIGEGGGTPLGQYMKRGADELLKAREKQFGYGTYRLLIVTDGEAGDRRLVETFTPDIIARGITIDVIGVEMASRHTLATRVHSYRNANNPESLRQAISEVFAEVASSDGGTAGEDAFELIADLPEVTASAMLKSLSTSGNQPIGEAPSMRAADPPASAPSSQGSGYSGATGGSDLYENVLALLCGVLCVLGIPALVIYAIVKANKK
ncbi:MAG: VWA domain-containing protein [Verrucomicrobiota bacterium]|nr:VWA domain-containing protein [Verrucomicrobiota bacterium]